MSGDSSSASCTGLKAGSIVAHEIRGQTRRLGKRGQTRNYLEVNRKFSGLWTECGCKAEEKSQQRDDSTCCVVEEKRTDHILPMINLGNEGWPLFPLSGLSPKFPFCFGSVPETR